MHIDVVKLRGYSLIPLNADKWNRISHPMTKNEFGIWEIIVPPTATGECAIPHDSKVKVCTRTRITLFRTLDAQGSCRFL